MYGCESWSIKNAECWRTDAFELWYWRRLLRILWTSRKSNQSILSEINPEYSLEGLMLKLKLQYFGYLMWRVNSLEKTLMLGKIEGRKRSKWQIATPTQKTWIWAKSGRQWRTEEPGVLQSMGLRLNNLATEQQQTDIMYKIDNWLCIQHRDLYWHAVVTWTGRKSQREGIHVSAWLGHFTIQ